jgi:hypothetical protein
MNRTFKMSFLGLILISCIALSGCSTSLEADPDTYTFVAIHFEAGYAGKIENDLPIDLPADYLAMDFGGQKYLFETAVRLVQKADDHGFHLTLMFNPQWAEYILLDESRTDTVRQWQERGHEIAFHHHSYIHPDWNGYSNDPDAASDPLYLGDVDTGLEFLRNVAAPSSVTTAMVGGLPIDLPLSFDSTTDDLIFTGGNQYDSFELYGELRSLVPTKVVKNNGGTVVRVAHRQLTILSDEIPIAEALETFKAEYASINNDDIYGIVFHCFEYREAETDFDEWFEFIESNGDRVRTVSEVVSDYNYDIPVVQ